METKRLKSGFGVQAIPQQCFFEDVTIQFDPSPQLGTGRFFTESVKWPSGKSQNAKKKNHFAQPVQKPTNPGPLPEEVTSTNCSCPFGEGSQHVWMMQTWRRNQHCLWKCARTRASERSEREVGERRRQQSPSRGTSQTGNESPCDILMPHPRVRRRSGVWKPLWPRWA